MALHCPARNAISPEVFNEFSKTFFSLKEEEAGYCGWKFQMHRHFHFPIVTTFPTSQKCKNFNFKSCTDNFQKLFFRFPIWSNVTTFPTSRKCKNFNFPLYTVPAEMLYLQKYLTNFQKLFFRWKKRKVTIVIGNFKCTDIFVFQRQRYNFSNIPKM